MQEKYKIIINTVRFLRKIENKTKNTKIRNLQITPINDKITDGQLRWFGMSNNRVAEYTKHV